MKTADMNPTEKIPTHAEAMFTRTSDVHNGRPVTHFVAEESDFGQNRIFTYAPGGTLRVLKVSLGNDVIVFVQESKDQNAATYRATTGDAVVIFND